VISPEASAAVVDALVDRAEIAALSVRYATALDRREWSLLRSCFATDAIVEYEGMPPIHGLDAVIDVCKSALDRLDASQHLIGNQVVELDGDLARPECYLQAQHVRRDLDGTYIVAGTYSDLLRREPAGWRIVHRRLAVTWTDGNRAVLAS